MPIIKSQHAGNYTTLPNEIFESNLSPESIGVLAYFLSLPAKWVIYKTIIHKKFNIGEKKMDRIFKELQSSGYVISVKTYSGGKIQHEHIVYDKPFNGEKPLNFENLPHPPFVGVRNAGVRDAGVQKEGLYNKQVSNKQLSKETKKIYTKNQKEKKIKFPENDLLFKKKFEDYFFSLKWPRSKVAYYYSAAAAFSKNKNKKSMDWIADVERWALRNLEKDKLVFKNEQSKYTMR